MSSTQTTLVGQTLKDRYLVQKPLGAGGMGSVFEGVDQDLSRPIVVKVPHATFLSQPGFLIRFQKEIGNLLALEHKNVVKVLDAGTTDNELPYLVLQFLRGGNLQDRLADKVTSEEVLEWLPQIAEALDFIHARGYVHRDIKPANILFDDQGHPYVADFGITKALGDENTMVTAPGYTPGTPNYMAPEAESTNPLTGAYDQYALAVVVYQALSGAIPHQGTTPYEILNAKKTQKPVPLSKAAPHVPSEVARAVMVSLEKEPRDRYPSCKTFAMAFEEAHRASTRQTGSRATSRLLAVAGAVFVLAAAALGWFVLSGDGEESGDGTTGALGLAGAGSFGDGSTATVSGQDGGDPAAGQDGTTGGGDVAGGDAAGQDPGGTEPVGSGAGGPGSSHAANDPTGAVASAVPWTELRDALEMAFDVGVEVALGGEGSVDREALTRDARRQWDAALDGEGLVVREREDAELVLRATYSLTANESLGMWSGLGDGTELYLSEGERVAGADDSVGAGDSRKAFGASAAVAAKGVLANLVASHAEELLTRELPGTGVLLRTVDVVLPEGADPGTVRRALLKGEGFDVEETTDGVAITFQRGRLADVARYLRSMSFGDGRALEIASWNDARGRLVLRLADL
jgi:hypothetical protein